MQKDVIYIDVEDDITSIISKIKAAESGIVALVPPKRTGAIQSAVNLKLVHRAAERADKRLVIITANAALSALAGSAGIPVAKNLQSRPEMAEIPALEIDDDVIEGVDAEPKTTTDAKPTLSEAVSAVEAQEKTTPKTTALGASSADSASKDTANSKKGIKIPDFNSFRKKFFLIAGSVVLLIVFLVWALVFAPRASIIISAQTSSVAVNTQIKSSTSSKTNLQDGTLLLSTKTKDKTVSKSFTATGKKEVGEKATGTVSFSAREIATLGTTIKAGTVLSTSSGAQYTTDESVTISISNYRGAKVKITAVKGGSSYNGATGTLTGAPSGVTATVSGSTSGGTDKTIAVVQQSDINKAVNELLTDSEKNDIKSQLQAEFGNDYIVVSESFLSDESSLTKPAVDSEATGGTATITGVVKFSLSAIARSEFDTFLKAYCQQRIDGKANQKIYDTGVKTVSMTNISFSDGVVSATITANGKVGPKIDEDAVKEYVKGQSVGEVQERVKTIEGIKSVDVKFSPFWVYRVPNDTKKIEIKFEIDD